MKNPVVVCMDLEGVLIPEIWIAFAEKTGIPELRLTTRDVPDYHQLMMGRLRILKEHGLKIQDIQEVIATMAPLEGAIEYMEWLRPRFPHIIISDTFYEFAAPLMKQLGNPTLFCNNLEVNSTGEITGYKQRLLDGKRHAALAFKQLNFRVAAMGDSFNDTSMLAEAELGILFRPSDSVRAQFPNFPVVTEYKQVQQLLTTML